jgi:hypothetical protein
MMNRAHRARGAPIVGVVLLIALSGCSGSSGRHAAPLPQPSTTLTTPSTTTATTAPGSQTTTSTTTPQTSGPRTVLSPIGLNVRAQPAKTASVLGTAAQGAVLTVLAHAAGWFQVKGATVTGWISDSATLSAKGTFGDFLSSTGDFGALYPAGWTTVAAPPASVVFRAPSGGDTIVVTTAATVALLGTGRAGYRATGSEEVVACGVTSYLISFVKVAAPASGGAAPLPNLAQVRLTLDPQHALGIDANLTDLSQLQTVRDFVNSVTFPFPQCQH